MAARGVDGVDQLAQAGQGVPHKTFKDRCQQEVGLDVLFREQGVVDLVYQAEQA